MDDTERERLAMRELAEVEVDKTWRVPGYEGSGPVTMTLRLPEVRITDAEGRYVIISPRQADLVSARMAGICYWLRYGDEDHVPEDADDQE